MPVTYYSAQEYETLKRNLEADINNLCQQIRTLRGEPCRQRGDTICCGQCQFHKYQDGGPKCTDRLKYLSK